jgi:MYXO-CTERM domain-containing protein
MRALLTVLTALSLVLASSPALADEANCPAGSMQKTEEGATWCEPTVCETDTQCGSGEVCSPVPLCVEVGTLKPSGAKLGGDAGQRLMARQKCGADKSCPQATTCSDMKRCVSRASAERMNAPTAPTEAPKKSCGCRVAGAPTSGLGLALAGVALALAAARRRPRA